MTLTYSRAVALIPTPNAFSDLSAALLSLFPASDASTSSPLKWVAMDRSNGQDFAIELRPRTGIGSAVPNCRVLIAGSTLARTPLMAGQHTYAPGRLMVGLAPRAATTLQSAVSPFDAAGPYAAGTAWCGFVNFLPAESVSQLMVLTSKDDLAIYGLIGSELFGTHVGYSGEIAGIDGEQGLIACLFTAGIVPTNSNHPRGIWDEWPSYVPGDYTNTGGGIKVSNWMAYYSTNENTAVSMFYPGTSPNEVKNAFRDSYMRQGTSDLTVSGTGVRYPRLEFLHQMSGNSFRRAFGLRIGYGKGPWHGTVESSSGSRFYSVGKLGNPIYSLMYPVSESS